MLLLHAPGDPRSLYSRYLGEILRLEGFVDWDEGDLAGLTAEALARHDLVVVPRLTLTAAQAALLADYVTGGGRLLALLPDDGLLRRLGLRPTFRVLQRGWLHPAAHPALAGLCGEAVQIVVPAAGWTAAEGQDTAVSVLARLQGEQAAEGQGAPGVVHVTLGEGEAVLFAYDLAHAVARLRQGDPELTDLTTAGLDGIYRATDLFVGQLEPTAARLPQADVHTALLGRALELLAPRPRLWYYPAAKEHSIVVMTSDDDWSTVEQFEALPAGLRRRSGRCTFYIVPGTRLQATQLAAWEEEGHTFSVHPALDTDHGQAMGRVAESPRVFTEAMLRDNVARHRREYGRPVRTIRQHCIRWLGYVEAARILDELGVGLDTNYFAAPPFNYGYLAGSGRPLRFVETDGTVLGLFQQPTLWSEECLIHPTFLISLKWSVERALAETTALIRRAAREFYTPVCFNSHPVSFATYSAPLVEGQWDAAREEGLRIVSADDWLAWTEQRAALRLEATAGGWLLHAARAVDAATLLFPAGTSPAAEGAQTTTQTLWGRDYTALTLRGLRAGERRPIAAPHLTQHSPGAGR